jgi:ElaB/YqjD/DUF883 family membrane-anchored ribosome-binding protein
MDHNQGANMDNVSAEGLMKDMRAVIVDAEDLLKATAAQTGERVEKVRAKAEDSLRVARERMKAAGTSIREKAADVDEEVRAHPWAAAGVAAGIGLLVGVLIARR